MDLNVFIGLISTGLGNFDSYFEVWGYLNDYFYNLSFINSLGRNYSFLLIVCLYFILYFIIFYSIGLGISKIFRGKKIAFGENAKYFSWLYLITPILMFIYPILLGISDSKLSRQLRHIFIGSIISIGIIIYIESTTSIANGINIIYFFPVIILLLLIWKEKTFLKKYIKYGMIGLLIFILFTQPFYRQWFYDKKNPENQKICYSRSFENNHRGPCFKIFKGFDLQKYLRK